MKKVLFALMLWPSLALAQFDPYEEALRDIYAVPTPSYAIPIQPVLPVPQDDGPYGTGYSVVTKTQRRPHLWDNRKDAVETTQRVVPNDWQGKPIRGLDWTDW